LKSKKEGKRKTKSTTGTVPGVTKKDERRGGGEPPCS